MNKETFNKVKEFMSNSKNRALVTLGIYVLFFILVGTICRNYYVVNNKTDNSTSTVQEKTPIEKYAEMANYEVKMTNNMDNAITICTGKVYRTNMYLTLNGISYYVNDNVYQIDNDTFKQANIDKVYLITPGMINSYIGSGTIVGKNEDYENKVNSIKYSVQLSKIDSTLTGTFYITTYESNNEILKVDIDITQYVNTKFTIPVTSDIVTYEYSNLNGVSNFTNMFSEDKIQKGVE